MPRSTRAPPDEQDSISRAGCSARISSSNRYTARVCACTAGPPAIRLAARLDEVAVVVPLDVRDVVLGEQGQDLALHVLVRPGDGQVEHLLVA